MAVTHNIMHALLLLDTSSTFARLPFAIYTDKSNMDNFYSVGISSPFDDQFFTFDGDTNVTIQICHPVEAPKAFSLHSNHGQDSNPKQICESVYISLPQIIEGNNTAVVPPWNLKGNVIGLVSLIIGLPIVSSICLWCYTKIILSRNPNILRGKDGQIRPPKTGVRNQVWILSFTFTAWYCVVMSGLTVYSKTFPYFFLKLNQYVSFIDWITIISYIKILVIVIVVLDTLLMLLMWIPTYSLKLRVWQMYYRLIGDLEKADEYERRKAFYLTFRFIQFGFAIAFGLILISMMLSMVIVLIAVSAVGFSYMFSQACVDVARPTDGFCIDMTDFGAETYCGQQLITFCNQWRVLDSSAVFWSAMVIAVGHYYLIGTGGMSFYQQVSVNLVLDSMEHDESKKESSENCNVEIEEAAEVHSQRIEDTFEYNTLPTESQGKETIP
jgi:hypothetical protein